MAIAFSGLEVSVPAFTEQFPFRGLLRRCRTVMLIWSVAAIIGTSRGWSTTVVTQALAFSLLASIGGALTAAGLSGRWSRLALLCAGALVLAASAVLMVSAGSYICVALATAGFAFAWNLVPAFQMGLAAAMDPSGRLVVLSIAAVKLGYAAGVSIATVVLSEQGPLFNSLMTALAMIFSVLVFVRASRRIKHDNINTVAEPSV